MAKRLHAWEQNHLIGIFELDKATGEVAFADLDAKLRDKMIFAIGGANEGMREAGQRR